MKKQYDEVMARIEVSEEMRSRILGNIQKMDIATAPKNKVIPFSNIKKYLSVAACFVVLLAGALAAGHMTGFFQPDNPVVIAPGDGIVNVDTVEELSACVGFEVEEVDSLPFAVEETAYTAYWQELAEISYTGGGQSAKLRMSVGAEDNSGDYNAYANVESVHIGSMSVTLKGSGETYTLAIWSIDGYAYSIHLSDGISESEWRNLIDG